VDFETSFGIKICNKKSIYNCLQYKRESEHNFKFCDSFPVPDRSCNPKLNL
jgi:hypothetical protein